MNSHGKHREFALSDLRSITSRIGASRASWMALAGIWLMLSGCGGSSASSPSPTPSASPTPTVAPTASPTPTPVPQAATNASVFAVDCTTQRAYIPMPFLTATGGEVAELDLSVDPAQKDPRIGTINLGIDGYLPRTAAADPIDGEVLITSDNGLNTGNLQLLNESSGALTSYSFPTGSRPRATDGVVYDTKTGTAMVSMSDSIADCTAASGGCTGTALFNLAKAQFGPLLVTGDILDGFAYDGPGALALGSTQALSPNLIGINPATPIACSFADDNIVGLNANPDAIAVDPTTNIWVVGNLDSPSASVVNLTGSSFTTPPNCLLNEGGTPPNSVNFNTQSGSNMAGTSINALTHQALISGSLSNAVALLTLPSKPASQLTAAMVSGINSSLPQDPLGNNFIAATYPYATVIDSCHNFGYILEEQGNFLVQIDLAAFQNSPTALSTALPTGQCAGTTSTTFSCDNGAGVKFFPLPSVQ
ncbi:MAG TPA: hypothetical protein VKV28_04525 [Candidatus Binataceae bacterium]|nr:hypothetical protein [Candidatus Binataceae bacterium]